MLNICQLFVFGVRVVCASCFGRDLPVIHTELICIIYYIISTSNCFDIHALI